MRMARPTDSEAIISALPHQAGAREPKADARNPDRSSAPPAAGTGGGRSPSGATASGPLVVGGWWIGLGVKPGAGRGGGARLGGAPASGPWVVGGWWMGWV